MLDCRAMAWMAKFDARAARWSWPTWSLYQVVKWFLVVLGAYALTGHFVLTWGWPATIAILGGPLLYGLWQGLSGSQEPGPPA